ncbi:DUF7739 domain-containing protein [Streptomyces zaomyceticus]|uniref:DUF7739 domain-containing protein n=1 Tax=Streptomyces zaomyceticus TaxID=68286 RepID=UPI0037A44F85
MTTSTTETATRRHLVTSHGADFFGQDRYPLPLVTGLADYVRSAVPYAQLAALAETLAVLKELDQALVDGGTEFPPAAAAVFADALLQVARLRTVKPKISAVARFLADAAARASADGESWEWRIEQGDVAGGEW